MYLCIHFWIWIENYKQIMYLAFIDGISGHTQSEEGVSFKNLIQSFWLSEHDR